MLSVLSVISSIVLAVNLSSVPDSMDPSSMKSVVGIIYCAFCLLMFIMYLPKGFQYAFWVGSSTNLTLFIMAICFIGLTDDSTGFFQRAYISQDKTSYIDWFDSKNTKFSLESRENDLLCWVVYKDTDKPTYYPMDQTAYKMHIKGSGHFYVSPQIFHPACFVWWPLVMCIPAGIEVALWIGFLRMVKNTIFD